MQHECKITVICAEEASAEETEEILADIESLSDDDLIIATVNRFTV